MRSAGYLFAGVVVAACNFEVTEETVGARSTMEVCQTYTAAVAGNASKQSGDLAARELSARSDFTADEIELIAKGLAVPGMSEEAGLCAWGGYWRDVNRTTTSGSVSKQYIFGDGQFVPLRYLYTRNGIVVGTQD